MNEVIELNNHRLLCGDATDKECRDKLIGDNTVNLLLTDPPYGIDIVKIGGGAIGGQGGNAIRPFNNRRSQTTNIQRSEQWEHLQDQGSQKPQRMGGGTPQYGKVGKPRHCSAKIIQTRIR